MENTIEETKKILDETTKMGVTPQRIEAVPSAKLVPARPILERPVAPSFPTAAPFIPSILNVANPAQVSRRQVPPPHSRPIPKKDLANAHMLRELCRQLYLSVFFREHAPVRSLGFTSTLGGEGKSFLSAATARVLTEDITIPVTLLECNWEHPSLHEYFDIAPTPGLAEWLRGECSEKAMRHEVGGNLIVIPAGHGGLDAIKLLYQVRRKGLLNMFAPSGGPVIVDLPAIAITGYGLLAASLVESLFVVVRAGVTSDLLVADTASQLKNLPVQGMILCQVESHVPRWLRQLL